MGISNLDKQKDVRAMKATEPQKGQPRGKLDATPKSNGKVKRK